jgi:outer membrane protein OmpA-like peptidoglycan-associated protein
MSNKESFWIPYADLMTVLMVIFLFISITYMGIMQAQKNEQDKIFKDYIETKKELYSKLNTEFASDFKNWNIELDKDLSIKFTNPDVLFESGSPLLRDTFRIILQNFLPKYFNIVLDPKYRDKISEIRIEGHTDNIPAPKFHSDPYIANLMLSQYRSTEIVYFFRNTAYFRNLSKDNVELIEYWLTANGLSFGRTIDTDKKLTFFSKKQIDLQKSRRVEFRIVTKSEELVEKVINNM